MQQAILISTKSKLRLRFGEEEGACGYGAFPALTQTGEAEWSRLLLTTTGCSAAGSARGLGPRCRRFESCHSDQRQNNTIRSPAAARRRPVDRWCCFSFPTRRSRGGPPSWLLRRGESVMNTRATKDLTCPPDKSGPFPWFLLKDRITSGTPDSARRSGACPFRAGPQPRSRALRRW